VNEPSTGAPRRGLLLIVPLVGLVLAIGFGLFTARSNERSAPVPATESATRREPAKVASTSNALRDLPIEPRSDAAEPQTSNPSPLAAVRVTRADDEERAMEELRALWPKQPERALAVAEQDRRRFGASAFAAEREWIVVRSLTNLDRFDEAREEARRMLELYPNDSFSADVKRHVLIHPPGPPTTPSR
jgi:type IV secretory pathway VirB10-like protein